MLVHVLKTALSDQLHDHSILLWYDPGGTLRDIVLQAVPEGVRFLPWEGSYLALRLQVEEVDPRFEQRWLVYVPEAPPEPSWLRDWELFGQRLEWDLERLLAERFGLISDADTRKLLAAENGRRLAMHWSEVMGTDSSAITKARLVNGLLGIAFGLVPFDLRRGILEYVSRQEHYAHRLDQMGLRPLFARLIRDNFGLPTLPDDAPALPLAVAILFSELVERSGGQGEREYGPLLPEPTKRVIWVGLADDWAHHDGLREGFLKQAREVQAIYALRDKLTATSALAKVQSFPAVDEVILEELSARLKAGETAYGQHADIILARAREREQAVWSRWDQAPPWRAIRIAAELYQTVRENLATFPTSASLAELVQRYADDDGWWRLDDLALELHVAAQQTQEHLQHQFIAPAWRAYDEWLKRIIETFTAAAESQGAWQVPGIDSQRDFWAKHVAAWEEKTAVMFIDALRFDLAQRVRNDLAGKGYGVTGHTVLASLPTTTEVGMAALLPNRGHTLRFAVDQSSVHVLLGDADVTTRDGRRRWLQAALQPTPNVVTLDELLNTSEARLQEWSRVIVLWEGIDVAGTFVAGITPNSILESAERVSRAVQRLHQAGFQRVIVGTDHGFLLLPPNAKPVEVEGIPSRPDIARGRRYALGQVPCAAGCAQFSLEAIGFAGEGYALFPKGLACFALQGETGIFLHQGPSPQETVVQVLVSEAPVALQKVSVTAEIPEVITSVIFFVSLRAVRRTLFDMARQVRVEVYSGVRRLAESIPVTLQEGARQVQLRLDLGLMEKAPEQVTIQVVDTQSGEVIVPPKQVKVSIL